LWCAFGRYCEILCFEWCVGFEADGIAPVAQIEHRTSSRADGTAFQAILTESYRAKVFAVAAVLPLKLKGKFSLTLEVQFAQQVTFIRTFDGTLPGSQESSFVLGTEYSHFRCSL
jgi:hypothetical protein